MRGLWFLFGAGFLIARGHVRKCAHKAFSGSCRLFDQRLRSEAMAAAQCGRDRKGRNLRGRHSPELQGGAPQVLLSAAGEQVRQQASQSLSSSQVWQKSSGIWSLSSQNRRAAPTRTDYPCKQHGRSLSGVRPLLQGASIERRSKTQAPCSIGVGCCGS